MILKKIKNNTLRSIKNLSICFFLWGNLVSFSQNDTLRLGSGGIIVPISAPAQVQATDGKYADRIDISWQYAGGEYVVYRSDNPNSIGKNISSGWQRTNYFSDRSTLQSGKNYYYRVKMRRNGQESPHSSADIGYLMPIAGGRISDTGSTTSAPQIGMSMGILEKDTINSDRPFDVTYSLENKGLTSSPLLNIRFYLSQKEAIDTESILLSQTSSPPLSGRKPSDNIGRIRRGAVSISIPKAVSAGSYFLIMSVEKQHDICFKKIEVK